MHYHLQTLVVQFTVGKSSNLSGNDIWYISPYVELIFKTVFVSQLCERNRPFVILFTCPFTALERG